MPDPIPPGFLPLKEAAERFGLSYGQLYKWWKRGLVRGQRVSPGLVLVDVASVEDRLPPPGWAWLTDALKRYSLSRNQAERLIEKGAVRVRKRGNCWQVELASLEAALEERKIPPGWITTREAGRRLGMSVGEVRRRVRVGQLRHRAQGRRWLVEEAAVEGLIIPPGWITTREASQRTGWPVHRIYRWIHKGKMRARKVGGIWIVEEGSL